MMALVILLELATRFLWSPNVVGSSIYGRYSTSYSYGYDESAPLFFRVGDRFVVYPIRGRDIPEQFVNATKGRQEFRVFVFGTSASYGPESYPSMLERALVAARPDTEWHVVNLSMWGAGSARMLLLLNKAIAFQPDLVILAPHGLNEYEDERDRTYRDAFNSGYKRWLFRSHAVVLLKQMFDDHVALGEPESFAMDYEDEETALTRPENLSRWDSGMRRNLDAMIQIARGHQVPVVLIGRAERDRDPDGTDSERLTSINAILRQCATAPDALYFDTAAAIDAAFPDPTNRFTAFVDNSHLVPKGHAAVGKDLARFVLNRLSL